MKNNILLRRLQLLSSRFRFIHKFTIVELYVELQKNSSNGITQWTNSEISNVVYGAGGSDIVRARAHGERRKTEQVGGTIFDEILIMQQIKMSIFSLLVPCFTLLFTQPIFDFPSILYYRFSICRFHFTISTSHLHLLPSSHQLLHPLTNFIQYKFRFVF